MRLTNLIAMAAAAGISCQAVAAGENKTVFTAYVLDESVAPSSVTMVAEAQAIKMLRTAGISLQWHSGRPRLPLAGNALVIQMEARTPRDFYPGALAFAMPYEGAHIQVFYPRLQEVVVPATIPALLAHVLVHEITHILQGISRHSEEGIMKAHWDIDDYRVMQFKPLTFTQLDSDLIQRSVATRMLRELAANKRK